MAKRNRTEITSDVNTKLVPSITASIHRTVLNENLAASAVLKKDVITTLAASGGSGTVDFASTDTKVITGITQNYVITVTNIENGEVCYLEVNKQLGNTITFAGGLLDQTISKNYVNASLNKVVYKIYNKNGVVYANAETQNLHEASETELRNGTKNKYITPEKLQVNTWYEVGNDGGKTAYLNGWAAYNAGMFYKIDIFGNLIIQGIAAASDATSNEIFKFNDLSIIPTTDFLTGGNIVAGISTGIAGGSQTGIISVLINPSSGIYYTTATGWGTLADRLETRNCIVYNRP